MLKWIFDAISRAKFSLRWSLLFIVLSACFGIWRTAHFVGVVTVAPVWVAWVLSVCVEIALVAAAGIKGVAEVSEYEHRKQATHGAEARTKLRNARSAFWVAFMLVLLVAVYDSWIEYGFWFAGIALFFQSVQLFFIRHYLLSHVIEGMIRIDEVISKAQQKRAAQEKRTGRTKRCPCCGQAITVNNFKRHAASCQ